MVASALAVLATMALIALAIVFVVGRRRRRREEDRRLEEEAVKARVRKKAEGAVASHLEAHEGFLTDSGILSVLEMMEALAGGGNYAEAEKWAINAIQNHPNEVEVPLKLAEIYYQAGRKAAFVALVSKLSVRAASLPPEKWRAVLRMGRELAPEHPLFADRAVGSLSR